MKFSEFVARNENVCLPDIIPLLQQIYVNAHSWNIDDTIEKVSDSKRKYIKNTVLIHNIEKEIVKGKLVYDYIYESYGIPLADPETNEYITELKYDQSYVNVKSLIQYVVSDINDVSLVPDELLVIAGIDIPDKKKTSDQGKTDPAIAIELGTLRNEKIKWDTSIRAATEIGLLFYEGELSKPTTRAAFVEEFNSKVGGLPDTTVTMIYKALPSDYKHKGGKPKIAKSEASAVSRIGDLNTAIKAAVFAGSIYETPDAKDVGRLSEMLTGNKCQVPPTTVLEKIIEYVKEV